MRVFSLHVQLPGQSVCGLSDRKAYIMQLSGALRQHMLPVEHLILQFTLRTIANNIYTFIFSLETFSKSNVPIRESTFLAARSGVL